MNKIEIRNKHTNKVIFEYECEDNTIKKTVEKAIKRGVNLSYANLKNANLIFANLENAELEYSDLSNTDLSNANLKHFRFK